MNLAVNARDAMPVGGKLTLETAIVDLDADYANRHWPAVAGRFAMLAVTDSGMGMSAETQARIFEPFFTTKETGKGTGLGLATVYGIVKQNNGFIWVYSEVDHGTTFKLYFPIATSVERTENPCEQIVQQSGTETVLIVEDSPSVRSAARRILQRCGYKVLEAPNGKAGLALARKKNLKIDLLVTDVIMPEMSGREVAKIFEQLRPETKVLYMSGYTDDAIVRQGILQEGIAYLQKPFTGLTLSTRVREVLNVSSNGPRSAD
jgi:two-component system cell cycle sensor histidine kinase/response regulator CckA